MPAELHSPSWHLLDSAFPQANAGIALPPRTLSNATASLRIANLDRADPPGYRPGSVPRASQFNRNVFTLAPSPRMPAIAVTCDTASLDGPIEWRLVCRHVLARFSNTGSYRYRSTVKILEREWRGESRAASFTLFGPDSPYTFNDASRVMGGHGVLMVRAQGLSDYVHLRIAGANPAPTDVLAFLDGELRMYDANAGHMVRAVFAHESSYRQFAAGAQKAASMTFTKKQHAAAGQPNCRVRFDWPGDPAGFPLASFDFGVGISQWTQPDTLTCGIAWDWRENIRVGVNLFFDKLRAVWKPGLTWKEWADAAWTAYNGSGAGAAAYAKALAASADGSQVSAALVANVPELARLRPVAEPGDPGPWLAV